MSALPLIFLGGFLGSAHCVGMCGAFAIAIGLGSRTWLDGIVRQVTYSLGRVFTYSFFGVAAGWAGLWFSGRMGLVLNTQAVLAILAGTLLLYQGLGALGITPRWIPKASHRGVTCVAASQFRAILTSPRKQDVFLAGVLNGFLPCGLVYGYLALAASSADMLAGGLTMAAFGAGTLPALLLTGIGARALPHQARRRVFQMAACCIIVIGAASLYRGTVLLAGGPSVSCPACLLRLRG
jgi:sulfite exporter TauE/SafE